MKNYKETGEARAMRDRVVRFEVRKIVRPRFPGAFYATVRPLHFVLNEMGVLCEC